MSICNAIVRNDHALLCVDTDVAAQVGTMRMSATKLIAFPHGRFVIGGRGNLNAMWSTAGMIGALCLDFDTVLARLPDFARSGWHGAAMGGAQVGAPERLAAVEFVTVGWSDTQRAIVGAFVSRGEDGAWSAKVLREAVHAAPWSRELGDQPTASSEADLRELAGRQVTMHRRMHPGGAIGGNLWIARITRDAIKLRDAGEIVEPREPAASGVRVDLAARVAAAGGWAA